MFIFYAGKFYRKFLCDFRHDIGNLVEIGELTWEQKEQVLRELFGRMNNKSNKKHQFKDYNNREGKDDEDDLDYNDMNAMQINT
jgi:hypothetical protein